MKSILRRFGVVLAALAWLVALPQLAHAQGVDVVARGLAAQANADLPGSRLQAFEVPPGLGWDQATYPITPTARQMADGTWVGDAGLSVKGLFPGYASWPTYYVNVNTGNNANDCLSFASACKSLYQPFVKAAAASQTQIYIKAQCGVGVEFDRNNGFTLGGVVTTIQNINALAEAIGGRCTVGAIQPALTWTASGDGYTAPLSTAVTRVFDKLARDRFGNYVEFKKQLTQSSALTGMDTWSQISNVMALRRGDGQAPTAANTMVLVSTKNVYLDGTNQINFALTGATPADGFDLVGGDAAAFRVAFTGGVGGPKVVVALENCSLKYSGTAVASGAVGDYAVEGVNGLSYVNNCTMGASGRDATNQHNALGADSYVLWNNVTAYDTGKISIYDSNNLVTGHDAMKMVIICARGSAARGVSAHFINTVKVAMFCPQISGSLGDLMNTAGGNNPTEFKAEDNVEAWIDEGNLKPTASSGYGILLSGAAKLHLRNTPVFGKTVIQGTATVDGY